MTARKARDVHGGRAHAGAAPWGRRRRPRRPGSILIVTIWIILALAALVLVLAGTMRVEAVCSANEVAVLQAEAVEAGAIQYVLRRLDSLQGKAPSEADTPCEAVPVGEGAFWVIRSDGEDDRSYTYGITDEAAKVNLNTAPTTMLTKLPGMTEEQAACIVDWRDADENLTPGGAESQYYLLLTDPYQCKNAPLETVEELLLIQGVTRDILLGEDVNRNGVLDGEEDDADASEPPDNRDGRLERGLLPFVTVYSTEQNVASDGSARVNVNDAQLQPLYDLLRQNMSNDRAVAVLTRAQQERPFRNVLDFHARTGLTIAEFESIADRLTTVSASVLRGLINVNTAPGEVLACLPGLDEGDVLALQAGRAETDVDSGNLAWVAQALPAEKAAAIGGAITARSYRFSADIVSVAGNGRAFRRCRVVVDAQSSPPKVMYRQDLTALGWPLAREVLAALRAGAGLDEIAPLQTIGQEVR